VGLDLDAVLLLVFLVVETEEAKTKCGGLSTAPFTMSLRTASVEMTRSNGGQRRQQQISPLSTTLRERNDNKRASNGNGKSNGNGNDKSNGNGKSNSNGKSRGEDTSHPSQTARWMGHPMSLSCFRPGLL
jgi:hypothetical protein